MITIDLSTAIIEITSAYDTISSPRIPFFFVIGAGVSYPSIPLAAEIIEHCKEKAKARGFVQTDEEEHSTLIAYSRYFDRAYPQPIDRQRYLRSLIENKPITDANLRLAHLLLAGKITNLVITPNFDDLLSRSLSLFGIPHIVADHPHTVDRIDLEGTDIQIIHVHGSYRFYDCRNLQEEVEHRARPSLTSTKTMAAFLDRALSFRSPLVIGYSGWEGDVIMDALRRRLEGSNLPYRLYWYCYDESALETLPTWLRDHNDVRFVVAVRGDSLEIPNDLLGPQAVVEAESVANEGTKTLPAKIVFEALSRAFELDEPELTKDPVSFFAKQLRASVYPAGGKNDAVYFFGDVITRMERAAALEKSDQGKVVRVQGAVENDIEGKLETIKDLVRRSRYDEAIQVAGSLPLADLRDQHCVELYDIFAGFLKGKEYKAAEALRASDLLTHLGGRLISWDTPESVEKFLVDPLLKKAQILSEEGKQQEAIDTLNMILEKLDTHENLPLQYKKAYIKSRKAIALGALKEFENAIAIYDELIPELEKLALPRANWLLSQSRFNRAVDLANVRKSDEAVFAFDEYVRLYRDATDGWTQVLVAASLRDKADLLAAIGRVSEAIVTCDELIALYGASQHPQVSRSVNAILLLKAQLLESCDSPQQALELYEEILKGVVDGRIKLSSDRVAFLQVQRDRLQKQSIDDRPREIHDTKRRKRELKKKSGG